MPYWERTCYRYIHLHKNVLIILIREEEGSEDMTEKKKAPEGKYLMYKGKPLVREGNTICYGDRQEKCFLILEIMNTKTESSTDVPDDILIQVVDSSDPTQIIKQGAKKGLQDAFTIGMVWLDMALKD